MASAIDNMALSDFPRAFSEATETIIRRIGGDPARTEPVEAIVELDDAGGGVVSDNRGNMVEFGGIMEIPAAQDNSVHDHWVIGGELYHQVGESTSRDGGSQTIHLTRRKGRVAREPRVR
jgi:hypothetical protein